MSSNKATRSRTRQTMIPTMRIPRISMAELLPPATSRPAMPVADAGSKDITTSYVPTESELAELAAISLAYSTR